MTELASIKGQVAAVTGGAAGIGQASAERFAAEGAKVAIIDRDGDRGETVVEGIRAAGGEAILITAECTSEADMDGAVASIVDQFGRLDILAGCAGGFHSTPTIEEHDAETWRAGIEWNLTGIYIPLRAVIPAMKANNYGRIVSIGSAAGRTSSAHAALDYSAAKAAVGGLTRRAAVELAPFGITVNMVAPGTVMTPRIAVLHAERMEAIANNMPLGRLGTPEEIAHAVWYLSTPGAAFTTGTTLDVNGGRWTG
ncbi:MAG: SDR family oxidoreductase [Alphaproteobacteria bacterium]|nr:SDR family oxidoreductase [Alphaproteobacteria bacterium]